MQLPAMSACGVGHDANLTGSNPRNGRLLVGGGGSHTFGAPKSLLRIRRSLHAAQRGGGKGGEGLPKTEARCSQWLRGRSPMRMTSRTGVWGMVEAAGTGSDATEGLRPTRENWPESERRGFWLKASARPKSRPPWRNSGGGGNGGAERANSLGNRAKRWWRRRELNPRPRVRPRRTLHACPLLESRARRVEAAKNRQAPDPVDLTPARRAATREPASLMASDPQPPGEAGADAHSGLGCESVLSIRS